jgi:hypothetical protein
MTCKCVVCPECEGSGNVWRSFSGKYLGNHRCDDLDELETCEECRGSGVAEICDECQMAEELELEQGGLTPAPGDSATPLTDGVYHIEYIDDQTVRLTKSPSA